MHWRFVTNIFMLLAVLMGCASKNIETQKSERLYDFSEEEVARLIEEGQKAWKLRHEKARLLVALRYFELAYRSASSSLPEKSNIDRNDLAGLLARGYYQLGDYHESDIQLRMDAYKSGGEWAQKGLELNPYFTEAVTERGHFEPALKFLDKKNMTCLYWYMANTGKWALYSGVNTSLRYRDLILSMANRLEELDPTFFYGGVYRIKGAYYAVIPAYAGGDLNRSWEYFQQSLKIAPNYIGTKILMAQAFALYRGDKILFKKILEEVVKEKLNPESEIYSENYLEQKKAIKLLDEEMK